MEGPLIYYTIIDDLLIYLYAFVQLLSVVSPSFIQVTFSVVTVIIICLVLLRRWQIKVLKYFVSYVQLTQMYSLVVQIYFMR